VEPRVVPRIGEVELEHPFFQAALSGFSDLPMRRVARRSGAAYTLNEMALDSSVLHESDWQRQQLQVADDDHPVGGQLMGADPSTFAPAARLFANAGYDVIDINFGCPVSKVLNRCRGGYMLSDPPAALGIVRSVIDEVGREKPVTVKMRRGIDDSPESERRFFEIFEGALELGVSAVTVHGRTVEQKYRGPADWSFLERVKRRAGDRPVFGSGDLMSPEACVRMLDATGVDGVTIARGAMGDPWIFRQCIDLRAGREPAAPSLAEQRQVIEYHLEECYRYYDPDRALRVMLRNMVQYSSRHPRPKRLRLAFAEVATRQAFEQTLDAFYGPSAAVSETAAARE